MTGSGTGLKIRSAMLLAAGFGTRMRPLTDNLPKPLIPVGGTTLIDHALDRIVAAGIAEAVVNLHYRGAMIRAHLAGRAIPRIRFSEEAPEILETGGGIRQALPMLGDGPFAVLNADTVWQGPEPFAALVAAWDGEAMDGLLLLVPRARAEAHGGPGDFALDAPGGPPRPRGDAATAPFVFAGAQILAPRAFEGTGPGPFPLRTVWDRLRAAGRLRAIVHDGGWVDAGTPEGLARAEARLGERAP